MLQEKIQKLVILGFVLKARPTMQIIAALTVGQPVYAK